MDETKMAIEAYQRDARFRMLAQSCVARARDEYGPIDPERAEHAANEVATLATALLLDRVFTEDAALNAMRIERDHYRAAAERRLLFSPIPPVRIEPNEFDLPPSALTPTPASPGK